MGLRERLRALQTAVSSASSSSSSSRQPRVQLLPNAEADSAIESVPVFLGKPTREAVEGALKERGWAVFRDTGVESAEDFGSFRGVLFEDMEVQSYKTGVVRPAPLALHDCQLPAASDWQLLAIHC